MSKAKAVLKKVGFNPAVGEERTEKIELPGYEPFEITFRVPGADDAADISLVRALNDESKGRAMRRFIALNIVSWTLPNRPDEIGLRQLMDADILLSIFNVLFDAWESVKN